MEKRQLEAIAGVLTAALADFLKDKDFHTTIETFTLAKTQNKADMPEVAHLTGERALDCHFNEQHQWVCTRPH